MKGLILSGGMGIRLRPLTHTTAKQLLPVANRPVLFHAIETVAAAGIVDIGIVVGDRAAEIRAAVGDGERFGVRITYVRQDAPRGLAHAVQVAQPFVGDDDFVVYLGDNVIPRGITTVVGAFTAQRPDALILLARVSQPQQFGIAEFDGGKLARLVEKPAATTSDLAIVGVYLFTAAIFDAIAHIESSHRGELEITDAIQRMIDSGRSVTSHVMNEARAECAPSWTDAGSRDGLLEANRLALDELHPRVDTETDRGVHLEGKVVVETGALLRDCVVHGPAIIGADAVVERTFIGPYTSIAAECVLRGAEVENSILLRGSALDNVRIKSSVIGSQCHVQSTPADECAHELLLGDNARVELH